MKTVKDIAEFLNISEAQVKLLVNNGTLPCYRLSERIIRFDINEVKTWLRRCRQCI